MDGTHILPGMLEMAVTLRIAEICKSGDESTVRFDDIERCRAELPHKGDVLLYGSKRKGEAAQLFNDLVETVSVMAFFPGGVTIFGMHFEVN